MEQLSLIHISELTIVGVNEEVRRTMAFRPLVKIDVLIVGTWPPPQVDAGAKSSTCSYTVSYTHLSARALYFTEIVDRSRCGFAASHWSDRINAIPALNW